MAQPRLPLDQTQPGKVIEFTPAVGQYHRHLPTAEAGQLLANGVGFCVSFNVNDFGQSALPDEFNAISGKGWISCHNGKLLRDRLGDQQAIKWITMVKRSTFTIPYTP